MYRSTVTSASSRQGTEDRARVFEVGDGLVLVVADGAGGIPGGGRAADLVVEAVEVAFTSDVSRTEPGIADLLLALDERIEQHPETGETTAVLVAITPSGIVGASAGDSQAWLIDDSGCDALTEGQHRRRRLGSGRALPVGFNCDGLGDGILIVATDGLWNHADAMTICDVVRAGPFECMGTNLIELVRTPRGDLIDDVSVVVVGPAST